MQGPTEELSRDDHHRFRQSQSGNTLLVVSTALETTPRVGKPRVLFEGNWAIDLQAVVPVLVLLNHLHDKLRTAAFFRFRLT